MTSQNPGDQKPAAGPDSRAKEPAKDPSKASSGGGSPSKSSEDAGVEERAKAHADKAQNEDG